MSFRPTLPLYKKSSTSWLARQSRDPFVKARMSSPSSYRSRSAYKLIELNDKWGRFLSRPSVRSVVDLGAAPGGWSQVVAERLGWTMDAEDNAEDFGLREEAKVQKRGSWSVEPKNKTAGRGKIVALDLLPIIPIPGVQTLQMDFLAPGSARVVRDALKSSQNPEGTSDIVLSDMAANFSGSKIRDSQMSLDICHAVFDFAKDALTVRQVDERGKVYGGGILLLKHFAHPLLQEFRKECLEPNFHLVHYIKPESSRADSAEGYWLCRGWLGKT
ncbi:ribosomal RNA methyltransferase FtsJ domain-containing protein [Suillus clintonianus]|uniref:ribosomal RNA methyltransferase FtsJ domain-containing protein n=1 Tax=Suillus clintonianus TaxID=1904413 RepID=UPI001B86B42A|nr:ribosomal RNA methyltransferase FtsJ domain-containing protein [Suillus clintonianus]KAG2148812.1 ribosomal RNA methyltransferase FtsJ domain-containing protein [Suillus clintonianus]